MINGRILFFAPALPAATDGILYSQLLSPAGLLHENGADCLFIGAERDAKSVDESTSRIESGFSFSVKIFPFLRESAGFTGIRRNAFRVARAAINEIRSFRPAHVYFWTVAEAGAARWIAAQTGAMTVYDVKGLLGEETALRRGRGPRSLLARLWQAIEARRAGHLLCVSSGLKEWLASITGSDKIDIIPSCADDGLNFSHEARLRLRRRWNIREKEKIVCYCGGSSPWQKLDQVFSLFAALSSLSDRVRFLVLSRDIEMMRQKLALHRGLTERTIVDCCEHREVHSMLSAADFGVILREQSLLNKVSSPVKISEYLACGLSIIGSPGIGDHLDECAARGTALLVKDPVSESRRILAFINDTKRKENSRAVRAYCDRHLRFANYLPIYEKIFSLSNTHGA